MENSETRIEAELEQQHTGNHEPGPDRFGGTRAGAEHVEKPKTTIEKGTDVSQVAPLDEQLDEDVSVQGPAERAPERDERGRM